MTDRFKIVFDRLAEAVAADRETQAGPVTSEDSVRESDEIAELRRMVLELTEPEPTTYTTT